ncbi:MAG: bifunctional diaminohydroxyphosphoribosylaminopyrimidine deaminase/5-amino-6-(5-phosphoribosylamino)uracil reductase RibD [Candidatus Hydrogenedentes bacterium]|nr:bifunctional diaminohydroxyphosphoribosylaminopyrimidine deaminase/5-amino-6-(5-phosphoribosylamino)uracil reductase RibD [Candidatus Hydrogenedentota bacterium]
MARKAAHTPKGWDHDAQFMSRALELAAEGRGRTSPNPMVGCVIVRDGAVIGEGFHERAGEPHAEVNAVRAAGGDIAGATVYVTLEPCFHEGRTPPCSAMLVEHKPERIVMAMLDPNPAVCGQGLASLRAAGVSVDVGVLESEARTLNEAFEKYITRGLPFVIAKCGMSLDGKIATHTGDSRWVTGEASRGLVHALRNEVDAILVGSRTVMLDDPSLTTRLDTQRIKDPVRVILDADDYLASDRRVFLQDSAAPTWVALPEGRDFNGADEVIHVPDGPGGIDLVALMRQLARREIVSVLIEGGGTTHASAFEAGIVDKVMFFIAPKIIGGRDAITAVEGKGATRMADVVHLERMTVRSIGEDILIEAYVKGE